MAAKIYSTRKGKLANHLVHHVVRSQKQSLSRYKLKKQAGLIENILKDVQIMGEELENA